MAHGIRAHWPTARNCPVFPVYVLALPRPALEKTLRGPTSVYGRRGDPGEGFILLLLMYRDSDWRYRLGATAALRCTEV